MGERMKTKALLKQDIPEIDEWIILTLFHTEKTLAKEELIQKLQERKPQITNGLVETHLQQLISEEIVLKTVDGYDLDLEICYELITQLLHSIELILKWKRTPYQLTHGVMGDIQHPNQS